MTQASIERQSSAYGNRGSCAGREHRQARQRRPDRRLLIDQPLRLRNRDLHLDGDARPGAVVERLEAPLEAQVGDRALSPGRCQVRENLGAPGLYLDVYAAYQRPEAVYIARARSSDRAASTPSLRRFSTSTELVDHRARGSRQRSPRDSPTTARPATHASRNASSSGSKPPVAGFWKRALVAAPMTLVILPLASTSVGRGTHRGTQRERDSHDRCGVQAGAPTPRRHARTIDRCAAGLKASPNTGGRL